MKQMAIFLWLFIGVLMVASVHDGRRINALEKIAFRLQTCSHGVAVMTADGQSSVSVCQP